MNKEKLVIPIHSFIDVVTNSSTSIYVGCHDNTIEYAKELIDTLLQVAGSDKKVDDLFTFEIHADFDYECDKIMENLSEYYPESELEDISWDKEKELAKAIFDKMNSGEIEPHDAFGTDGQWDFDTRTLIIKSKENDQLSIDLSQRLQNIFSIEAERDG